jgi:putative transposase
MKKNNPTRYSSAVGEIWVMATFKIKYCHKIFEMEGVRLLCEALFKEAFNFYKIKCQKITFDVDHVHMILDLGLNSKCELAKKLKGFVAKKLFSLEPWIKKRWFWGSGLWNPAYDIRSMNDIGFYFRYLDKQKYSPTGQKTLNMY